MMCLSISLYSKLKDKNALHIPVCRFTTDDANTHSYNWVCSFSQQDFMLLRGYSDSVQIFSLSVDWSIVYWTPLYQLQMWTVRMAMHIYTEIIWKEEDTVYPVWSCRLVVSLEHMKKSTKPQSGHVLASPTFKVGTPWSEVRYNIVKITSIHISTVLCFFVLNDNRNNTTFLGFHDGALSRLGLLGRDAVQCYGRMSKIRRTLLPAQWTSSETQHCTTSEPRIPGLIWECCYVDSWKNSFSSY
jgi:hypothetical protein